MGLGSGSKDTVNVARLHEYMDRERLDAVVARSGQNLTYLSSFTYPGTLARHVDIADSTRAVLLLWPRRGEPIFVLNAIAEKLTVRDSWIKRAVVYDAYNESPYARLCSVIKEAGLEGGRIGFEKNYLSAEHWEEVRRGLPRAEMVDCNRMMDAVRWVKTPAELAMLRKGADLLDDAYAEVFPTIEHGETERAVHSRLIASCLRRGANWAHGILNSNRNTIPYAGESDELFLKGDVVRTDYVAYLDGYPGHQSRVAIMGKPSAALREDYARYHDAYVKIIDRGRRVQFRRGDLRQAGLALHLHPRRAQRGRVVAPAGAHRGARPRPDIGRGHGARPRAPRARSRNRLPPPARHGRRSGARP